MNSISTAEFAEALEALDVSLPLVLAVSGGPDSVALMRLAAQWAENRSFLQQVFVVTVDHGLRPEAEHEAKMVASWASSVGLSHHTLSWAGEKPDGNVQAEAREARYALLADFCEEVGSVCLATAHHVDDQAETFLLRLARGSGVDGLAAMSATREITTKDPAIRIIRPLLTFSRDRLRDTLNELGQGWIEDPSNDDARYDRVKARNLSGALGDLGLTQERSVATSQRMTLARDALAHYCDDLFSRAIRLYPAGYCTLDASALFDAPREIGLRCLSKCLRIVSGSPYGPRYERLNRLYDALSDEGFEGKTLHGCQLTPHESTVLVYREYRAVEGETAVVPDAGSVLWDNRFWVARTDPTAGSSGSGGEVGTVEIRPLGEQGLARIRSQSDMAAPLGALPRPLTFSLPAIWRDDEVLMVPFGLYRNEAKLPLGGPDITFRLRVAA